MPCYHPLQAHFVTRNGKKELSFGHAANAAARMFRSGLPIVSNNILSLPCGKCMGCRLERSRQWAVRCMHEASLHEDNCFVTLTYSDEFLPFDGSLNKKHLQDFFKRLRHHFSFRYFSCGEYGDDFGRPHYHVCFFGCDFPDKVLWKSSGGYSLYESKLLSDVWGMGFCPIGSLTFDSAAYVARYCTKKVTGAASSSHYQGKQPEFGLMSNKPGIGADWYRKWKEDCFPSDYLVINGVKCKPPRYYDKMLEKEDPLLFEHIKQTRLESAKDDQDNTCRRLEDREKCQQARFSKLIRTIERSNL